MSEGKNNNLRVVRPDSEEAEKQRRRRRRARRITLVILLIAVAVAIALILLVRNVSFTAYAVTGETDRSDTTATHYLAFGDGYVKYSNDGAAYVTDRDETIWNQGYEMENPMVAVCSTYLAFADRLGETVYVLDEEGVQGEIALNMPISRIAVASQGTVAVLMADSGTSYLSLFDKSGGQIAEGAIHVENTGTPLDIALSEDGQNLAVSIVDVSSGTARTSINFYNFSAAGQNQIDNLVGSFIYEETIIPEIVYAGGSTLIAFADTGVYVFEGANSPQETAQLAAEDEIQSIFYDDSYFGLVYNTAEAGAGRVIRVYDSSCRERAVIETENSYDSISFLDNHEICLLGSNRCDIYTLSGFLKFSYAFDDEVTAFFHGKGYLDYVLMKEGVTEHIRLRLFASLFGTGQQSEAALDWEAVDDTEDVTGTVSAESEEEDTE